MKDPSWKQWYSWADICERQNFFLKDQSSAMDQLYPLPVFTELSPGSAEVEQN